MEISRRRGEKIQGMWFICNAELRSDMYHDVVASMKLETSDPCCNTAKIIFQPSKRHFTNIPS